MHNLGLNLKNHLLIKNLAILIKGLSINLYVMAEKIKVIARYRIRKTRVFNPGKTTVIHNSMIR